ncbi:MAG: hypothetical protein PV345_01085 [Wolbachia sp.]|nr:hypothetical protein [Wolbachia sp.]
MPQDKIFELLFKKYTMLQYISYSEDESVCTHNANYGLEENKKAREIG